MSPETNLLLAFVRVLLLGILLLCFFGFPKLPPQSDPRALVLFLAPLGARAQDLPTRAAHELKKRLLEPKSALRTVRRARGSSSMRRRHAEAEARAARSRSRRGSDSRGSGSVDAADRAARRKAGHGADA